MSFSIFLYFLIKNITQVTIMCSIWKSSRSYMLVWCSDQMYYHPFPCPDEPLQKKLVVRRYHVFLTKDLIWKMCSVKYKTWNNPFIFFLFLRGGSFYMRGYEPILAILLFSCALALHSRQVDLKLRLDYLWAVQVNHRTLSMHTEWCLTF